MKIRRALDEAFNGSKNRLWNCRGGFLGNHSRDSTIQFAFRKLKAFATRVRVWILNRPRNYAGTSSVSSCFADLRLDTRRLVLSANVEAEINIYSTDADSDVRIFHLISYLDTWFVDAFLIRMLKISDAKYRFPELGYLKERIKKSLISFLTCIFIYPSADPPWHLKRILRILNDI